MLGISIIRKIFLALVDGFDVNLLLGGYFLLKEHFLHITPSLDHLIGRFIPFFLLFALFFEFELLRLFFFAQEVLLFLVVFDFFFDLRDKVGVRLPFPLDGESETFDLMFYFLDREMATVMAFFMIFSLLPSIFSLAVFWPISLKISITL